MAKSKIKVDLNFPKFDLQEDLESVALKVIRPDIEKKMSKGVDINGSPHKANTQSTKVNKALRGLKTEVPLVASGQLRSSIRVNLVGDNMVKLFPAGLRRQYPKIKSQYKLKKTKAGKGNSQNTPTNSELAGILQNRGVRGHKYEFFGISDKAEEDSLKFMEKRIRKAIRRGGRRTTK